MRDESPEAQIHLAKLQRAVGEKSRAIETLEALLGKQPGDERARALLETYTGRLAANTE
jgi:hypothetical protein